MLDFSNVKFLIFLEKNTKKIWSLLKTTINLQYQNLVLELSFIIKRKEIKKSLKKQMKKRIDIKKIRDERNRKICECFDHLLADGYSTNKALNEIGLIYCLTPEGIKKILKQNNVYRTTGYIKKQKEVASNE